MSIRKAVLLRIFRGTLLGAVGMAGIGSILATSPPTTGPFQSTGESFLLVYTDADTAGTRARISQAGLDWRNTGLEGLFPPPQVKEGVSGIGLPYSYARLTDSRWLFASVVAGGRLGLQFMDGETARPSGANLAPDHSLATGIVGWPAITVLRNRIMLAWRRGPGPRHALVTMTGEFRDGGLTFDEPMVFKRGWRPRAFDKVLGLPAYKKGVLSDPALSHGSYGYFQMVVVREARRGGEGDEIRYRAAVYESKDGRKWVPNIFAIDGGELPVGQDSPLAIAGFTDGTMVVAAMIAEAGKPARTAAVRSCFHEQWQELDTRAVFGGQPLTRPFALVSLGDPALPGPKEYLDCVSE